MGIRDLFFSIRAKDETGAAFSSVKGKLRDVDGMYAGLDQRLARAGKSMTRFGAKAAAAALPLGFAARDLIGSAADFEASVNRLGAVSNSGAGELEVMRDMAKDLGATTSFSAGQAADGMSFLAMAGFNANEILAATPGVLQLATAAQMDLADSADIVSNVLTGYGLAADEVGRANDVMVATMTGANTDLRQLGDAFKYVGPVAAAAGMPLEQTAAIIGKLSDAGIQGEMAGTALRGAMTRLMNPTKEVTTGLKSLGVEVTNSNGDLLEFDEILRRLEPHGDDAAAMMQIFGQRAGPAMVALLGQGVDGLETFTTALENAGGTAERVAKQQNLGLNATLKSMRSAWEGLGIAIADSGVLDMITALISKVTEGIRWLSEFEPWLLQTGAAIAGLALVIGPVTLALGGMVIAVQAIGGALLGLAAASGPIGLAIVGIGGLIGLTAALWPEVDNTTRATDLLTAALGDEITQSQLLQQALSNDIVMSAQAAQQKLTEARARYENVKAVIAEHRAMMMGSTAVTESTARIKDNLNSIRVMQARVDQYGFEDDKRQLEIMRGALGGNLRQRSDLLRVPQEMADQLARTQENIDTLNGIVAGAANSIPGAVEPIVPPVDRVTETLETLEKGTREINVATDGLGGSMRGAAAATDSLGVAAQTTKEKVEETKGVFDDFGKETAGMVKDIFSDGRVEIEEFGDFVLAWGDKLLDRLLNQVFDPIGIALQGLFDSMGSGGGFFGGIASRIGGAISGLFGGPDIAMDTGGIIGVSGRNGIDRNVANFRVSNNEDIHVVKRGQPQGGNVTVNIYPQGGVKEWNASRGQISRDISRAVARGHRVT